MPPEDQVKQWILLYYEPDTNVTAEQYWKSLGKGIYEDYSSEIKVNGEVKRLAASVTEGAKTEEEKVARLISYCRKNIKNVSGGDLSAEEREKARKNRSTLDTMRRGYGTPFQVELAFISLALAEGLDARLARLPDRSDFFFSKALLTSYFLGSFDSAVKINGQWHIYDVANDRLPIGMLRWEEEGVDALIADPKEPVFVRTPLTPAETSRSSRIGEFSLDSNGALEGDVRSLLSGHPAFQFRSEFGSMAESEREEAVRKRIQGSFPSATITKFKVFASDDTTKSVGFTYHIQVVGYAQRTGRRLFVTPAYFEAGMRPRFPESKREHPIYFQFPWSEYDFVQIKLPEGFELDHPDAPRGVSFGTVGAYNVRISVAPDKRLIYERSLSFAEGGNLLIELAKYPILKQGFDYIHESDAHLITLKSQAISEGSN